MLKIAYSSIYQHPLPAGHRFPMLKYELIPEQLLYEGTIAPINLFKPEAAKEEDILLTHTKEYWNKLQNLNLSRQEERRTGFPLSERLVKREIIINQGTIDCTHYAKKYGVAMNIAGGTHHAYADRGEGFCLLNDIAMASNYLLKHGLAQKILVVDLDVHQGNGTAAIFHQDDRLFTFSMHGDRNYPFKKTDSDLDVPLPDGLQDDEYLRILETNLRNIELGSFDFAFYIAGADPHQDDRLGRLKLSQQGLQARDEMVLHTLQSLSVPTTIVMGGGYGEESVIANIHATTIEVAMKVHERFS